MEVSQEDLEQQLMELLLRGDHPVLTVLRQQYAFAKIVSRKFSGVGFFTSFEVPDDAPLVHPSNFEAEGILIDLENLPGGADCVLFVRNGKLDFLECYTFIDAWPDRIVIKSLSNIRPAIPE
ncbi:MAG TPA: hypothetical protein VKF38_02820 [Anaerolineaceae bacterium]|nr:hypothetical protein [Anaerolineaceae bacterium]